MHVYKPVFQTQLVERRNAPGIMVHSPARGFCMTLTHVQYRTYRLFSDLSCSHWDVSWCASHQDNIKHLEFNLVT